MRSKEPAPAFEARPPVRQKTREVGRRQFLALKIAVLLGIVTSLFYFGWWFRNGRLANPPLALAFLAAVAYFVIQAYFAWYVYLKMRAPASADAPPGLTVDVLVPVYDEPYELVEHSLKAALAIRYPHRTVLLDDKRIRKFEELARRLGADYVVRSGNGDAKAGNVNACLQTRTAEFVAIFDVDHLPEPDFLDVVLGYFSDSSVGFVQSAVGFRNVDESCVAQAAAEQASDAYGPASMGMHGCDAAQVWGSHCTFRRSALESIGGHQTGLAEDLHTSLMLHAAGWRSVFVPEVKAHGLVPIDFLGVAKQQFKWARGVFEILLTTYPKLSRRLSLSQNIAYLLRCTYYLVGVTFLIHCLVAMVVLSIGSPADRRGFGEYLFMAIPFAAAIVLVRMTALAVWDRRRKLIAARWRLYPHTFLLWSFHTVALLWSIFRVPIRHISTPKKRSRRLRPILVLPQILLIGLLVSSVAYRVTQGLALWDWPSVLFAGGVALVQIWALSRALLVPATLQVTPPTPSERAPSSQWSSPGQPSSGQSQRVVG